MPADATQTVTPRRKADGGETTQEAITTVNQARDSLNQIAGGYMSVCSDTLAAAMESGSQTSRLAADMGRAYLDACGTAAANFAEIARDSLVCRSPVEAAALQKKAMDAFAGSFDATRKLYSDLFANYTRALEPLFTRTADIPERMMRAVTD